MATIYPQPLPPNSYNPSTEALLHDAYGQCLMMEAGAGADKDTLMLARCLGYLIQELPYEANETVAHEIVACYADFDKMSTLSRLYIDHLIRLFRRSKGRTPAPSEHPSRPSFETHSNFFSEAVEPAPTNHQTAKKSALRRDNYRCVVTGWADSPSFLSMEPADLQRYNLHRERSVHTSTNYCHIFPPSTNLAFNPNDPAEQGKYAGKVWATIQDFTHIDVLSELGCGKVHHLGNGFTMDVSLHTLFNELSLWFEHVADNTYRVCALYPRFAPLVLMPPNHTFTFTSTDPCLPLPNFKYLRLHAAVCRVAHLSGAAGYLKLEDRQIERLGVLAHDGSSADLLTSRLRRLALMA